ncbi:MAG: serine protease [Desulfobaccales bacterium]
MRSRLALYWMLWFLLLALFTALPQAALALTASQVYEQVKDSVVVVKAYDQEGKPVGLGSGVMLPSGDVITNYHVAKAGGRYMVGQGKKGVPASLKAGDPDKDLCLLSAPGLAAKPARLGRAAGLKVGEPVYAVGAPQGLELSLSEGIVSQLRGGPPPLIQTTVAISQGSSGGGLFNAEGELVGIITFYLKDSQSLNFAVPVEWINQVALRKFQRRQISKAPEAPEQGAIKRKKDIKIINTKLGDVAFIKGNLFECSVVLNNKIIYENNKLIISFHTFFNNLGEYEAILIQESSATRAWFRLILLRGDDFIKVTDQFGTGSDYISIDIKSGKTTFKFPDMKNKGDIYYIFEKGSLSKVAN